jgi:hypothetical protein
MISGERPTYATLKVIREDRGWRMIFDASERRRTMTNDGDRQRRQVATGDNNRR